MLSLVLGSWPKIFLFQPCSEFHGSDRKSRSGGEWWGLTLSEGTSVLSPSVILTEETVQVLFCLSVLVRWRLDVTINILFYTLIDGRCAVRSPQFRSKNVKISKWPGLYSWVYAVLLWAIIFQEKAGWHWKMDKYLDGQVWWHGSRWVSRILIFGPLTSLSPSEVSDNV